MGFYETDNAQKYLYFDSYIEFYPVIKTNLGSVYYDMTDNEVNAVNELLN